MFHFATVLLHEIPSSSNSNANPHSDKKRSTEQDRIHTYHFMSLPIASQNTQYYLQAGYGVACSVASAEMTLFVTALSVRFDHLEALPLRFDHAEVGFGAFI
jgi:hypothetical protein